MAASCARLSSRFLCLEIHLRRLITLSHWSIAVSAWGQTSTWPHGFTGLLILISLLLFSIIRLKIYREITKNYRKRAQTLNFFLVQKSRKSFLDSHMRNGRLCQSSKILVWTLWLKKKGTTYIRTFIQTNILPKIGNTQKYFSRCLTIKKYMI